MRNRMKAPQAPRWWTTQEAAESAAAELRSAYHEFASPEVFRTPRGKWGIHMNWNFDHRLPVERYAAKVIA
jgi:hypothetical protein